MYKNIKPLNKYPYNKSLVLKLRVTDLEIGYYSVPPERPNIYSKRFRLRNENKDLPENMDRIIRVVSSINPILYIWIIDCALDGEEGMGENDIGIDFEKSCNAVYFDYVDIYNKTKITYPEGIQLFYAYFSAYKKFIETQAPEMKNEMYSLDFSPEAVSKPWYPDFCDRLKKLKDLYNSMVEDGEIDPSNIQYPK